MKADGSAVFAVFDPNLSAQEFGSGTMEPADSSSYSTTQIRGDYAFGFAGFDLSNNRTAFAGRLSADGLGTFTNFDAIFNTSGGANETTVTLATYRVSDTSSGRGTISLAGLVGLVPRSFNFVFYVVNAGKLFVMETDPALLQNGVFLRQNMPAGGFTLASLNTSAVIYLTGHSACGEGSSPATEALVGLLIPNGGGALTLSHDQNCGGTDSSSSGEVGTYTVETNGHACIFVGTTSGVAFLVNSNRFFFVGTDNSVLFGLGEPQSIGSLTNSSVMGTYAGFTSTVAPFDGTSFSGEFIADGASPNGNLTGTEDTSGTRGPDSGVAVSATYSVSALPTNGRGTISIASGSGVSAIMYVVSPSKFVAVSLSDPNPAVQIFEQ
jgi:hypothetical protein